MSINVTIIPILGSHKNYAYLLEGKTGQTAIIDPGEAKPIIDVCVDKSVHLDFILTTHHHWDHTDGNADLVKRYGCQVIGPKNEQKHIKHLDIKVNSEDIVSFDTETVQVMSLPGHTSGHIGYYFPETKMLFCGDVLFGGGCGKVFEGTHEQMWESLQRISQLPDETKLYFGHEYTQSNLEFGLTIEPDNMALKERLEKTRTEGGFTTPSTVGLEKETNVFLRASSAQRFSEIRTLKDNG